MNSGRLSHPYIERDSWMTIERVFNLAGVNHNWDTAVQPFRGILDRSLLSEVDDDRNRVRVLLEKVAPASRMKRGMNPCGPVKGQTRLYTNGKALLGLNASSGRSI